MLHEKRYKEELEKAIGRDKPGFMIKIKFLQEKWQAMAKEDEYEETRIIAPFLFNKAKRTPVNTAVLSDNLDYFTQHYIQEYNDNDLLALLEVAALSGSKQVSEFLLRKLEKNYSSEGYQFVLSYAAVSPNSSWVKEIAIQMAEQGLAMPEDISPALSPRNVLTEIREIFSFNTKQGHTVVPAF